MSRVILFTQGHRVICPVHGATGLSPEQYQRQLARAWDKWKCPICNEEGEFDDEAFDRYCDWLREVS